MSATQSSKVRWKRRRRRRQPSGKASPGVSFFFYGGARGMGAATGRGARRPRPPLRGCGAPLRGPLLYPLPRLAGPVLGGAFSDQCAPSGSEASDSSESQTSEGSVTTSKAIATERAPRRVQPSIQVMSPSKRHAASIRSYRVAGQLCDRPAHRPRARMRVARVSTAPFPLSTRAIGIRFSACACVLCVSSRARVYICARLQLMLPAARA